MKIQLEEGAFEPTRAHNTDAGLDLRAMFNQTVPARGSAVFYTGTHVELPEGTAGFIVSKSGLNVVHDITATGLIDQGYDGAIVVKLYNHGLKNYDVRAGDKIAQLVVVPVRCEPVELVSEIKGGERGSNGFGSTGK